MTKWFKWKLLRVSGNSMVPALNNGDLLIAKRICFPKKVAVGDIVEIEHPDFGKIVKFVKELKLDKVRLYGSGLSSVDSGQIGWVRNANLKSLVLFRISLRGISRLTQN